jgi:hypothetical protein
MFNSILDLVKIVVGLVAVFVVSMLIGHELFNNMAVSMILVALGTFAVIYGVKEARATRIVKNGVSDSSS